MIDRIKKWWADRVQERRDSVDREEFHSWYVKNALVNKKDADYLFAKFKEQKYSYCQNCSCPQLYHDDLGFGWCRICDCVSFVMAPVNCRCLDVPILQTGIKLSSINMFDEEEH